MSNRQTRHLNGTHHTSASPPRRPRLIAVFALQWDDNHEPTHPIMDINQLVYALGREQRDNPNGSVTCYARAAYHFPANPDDQMIVTLIVRAIALKEPTEPPVTEPRYVMSGSAIVPGEFPLPFTMNFHITGYYAVGFGCLHRAYPDHWTYQGPVSD